MRLVRSRQKNFRNLAAFVVLPTFSLQQVASALSAPEFLHYSGAAEGGAAVPAGGAPFGPSGEAARFNTFERKFDSFGNQTELIARDESGRRTLKYRTASCAMKAQP